MTTKKPATTQAKKTGKLKIKEEAVGVKAGRVTATSSASRTSELPRGMCSSAQGISVCPGSGCKE